jgi:Eco57I restriction-modification methylase
MRGVVALSNEQLREIVRQLVRRPGHETVRSNVREILLHLGVPREEIRLEVGMDEIRGRADALLANTVLEIKSDLRREQDAAEWQLTAYLADRESVTGRRFVGVATDGVDFWPYELRNSKLVPLRNNFNLAAALKTKRDNASEAGHALASWLSPFLSLRPDLPPDPGTIRVELGRDSVAYEIARSRIEELWTQVKDDPSVKVKRELWAKNLSLVYGTAIGDDALFFQHTYLTVVAKTMATLVLGVELPEPDSLLSGQPFQDAGINGVVESDFFDWVLATPDGADVVHRINAQVCRFRLGDIKHDVLKVLYESLIDPEQRHDLGEYYTPDWLAEWICERVIDRSLEQRVLDPSCGSGTFLFHAVRRFLAAADATRIDHKEALLRCTRQIFGIDVHPVAVINARVTYLLAIGEERLKERPSLSIPVYLGDSLQWNTDQILVGQTVHISVPPRGDEETQRNVPNLTFPIRIAADPALFDEVVNEMLRLSEQRADETAFGNWLERKGTSPIPKELHPTLLTTYTNLRRLREEERNHIWGYVARNLSRPIWLSSNSEKIDLVVGNPPWLAQRDMSRDMQRGLREECKALGIWAGGKVATHQDLSGYFFARCVDRYLRQNGRIAFVMPYAAMSRQQYQGFREGVFAGGKSGSVRFTDAWTFDESVQPLFNVPSCVLFAREGAAGPLPSSVTAYSGQLTRRDASADEAAKALTSRQVPWPQGKGDSPSAYGSRFRQSATVVPRVLFVVKRVAAGRFGANPAAPMVESRRTNLEKAPWKNIGPLHEPMELEFLRPLYLGESVAPYRLLGPVEAVIPWDTSSKRLVDSNAAELANYRHLAAWLKQAETLWAANRQNSEMSLTAQLDYYGKLSAQMPPSALRVVYSASGTIPAAAILQTILDGCSYSA